MPPALERGTEMGTVNTLMTVILIGVIVYILFRPTNQTTAVIKALGGASTTLTRTLSGQYSASPGYSAGGY